MKPIRVVATAVGAGLAVIVLVGIAAHVTGDAPGEFTRDPAVLAPRLHFYSGSVSILTAAVWASVAALCLFAAWTSPVRAVASPLRLLALLSALLLADDVLELHEVVGPRLGIPQGAFYLVYAVAGLGLAWRLLPHRREPFALAFVLGAAFLAASILVDGVLNESFRGEPLLEDGFKLLGALVWLTVPVLSRRTAGAAPDAAAVDVRLLGSPRVGGGVR